MTENKFYQYILSLLQIITGILAGIVFIKELFCDRNLFTMIVTILVTLLGLTLGLSKLYHLHSKDKF